MTRATLFGTWRAYVLLLGVLLSGAGQTVIFTLLPPVARNLGLVELQAGTVFTVSAIFFTFLSPIWGKMSDRHGRRIFLVSGMIGVAISMFGFGLVMDLGLTGRINGNVLFLALVAMRSLSGIAGSAIAAAGLALVADLTDEGRRGSGMALYSASFGLGSIFGPAVAGLTSAVSITFPLYGLAAIGLVSAIGMAVFLPCNSPHPHDPEYKAPSWFDRRIARLLAYSMIAGIVIAIPMQVTGFYMLDGLSVDYGRLPALLGIVLTIFAGASLMGQLTLVRGVFQASILLWFGPLLVCTGGAIVAVGEMLWTLFFGMVLTGLGAGVMLPSAISAMSLRVEGREQGAVAGMTNSASALGFILAPFVGLGLHTITPPASFIVMAMLSGIMALPVWRHEPA